MKLREILADTRSVRVEGDDGLEIASLAYDSRRVAAGSLFFALKGLKEDGARFIPDAIARGAVACVAETRPDTLPAGATFVIVDDARRAMGEIANRFYGAPSTALSVIGVTGTNGKTTTCFMLESIFASAGRRCGLFGTVLNRIAGSVRAAVRTTPESIDLHEMLRECTEAGCTHVAMEVSSHALDLHRVRGVSFATAVFTNLTQDHLDFHRDMSSYRSAKLRLFEELAAGAPAVINRDSPDYDAFAGATRGRVLSYGLRAGADVTIEDCRFTIRGFSGTLRSPWGSHPISSPMAGHFNAYNALAALAAACAVGIRVEDALAGISALKAVPGRFETIDLGQFSAIIDYAHTPDALDNILAAVRSVAASRLICVFGCGGDRDRAKRPLMAAAVARHADRAVLTSDNPRSESPEQIIADAEKGFGGFTAYRKVTDRKAAIESALAEAGPGDLVVIAGKGHEDYQIFADRTIHFSDREVVLAWKASSTDSIRRGGARCPC